MAKSSKQLDSDIAEVLAPTGTQRFLKSEATAFVKQLRAEVRRIGADVTVGRVGTGKYQEISLWGSDADAVALQLEKRGFKRTLLSGSGSAMSPITIVKASTTAHATKKTHAAKSWEEMAADYKRIAKAAREEGGKVKIYPDGSILVLPTKDSDEHFYQDWEADEFKKEIERKYSDLLEHIRFEDLVLAQSQQW